MKSKHKLLITALLVSGMVQLSCMIAGNPDDLFEKVTCQWSGGTWHATPGEKDEGYCEEKSTAQEGDGQSGNQPAGDGDTAGSDFNPLLCDATGVLSYETEILRDETTEFGTEICDYKITFTSNQDQGAIWLVGYQHEADIWQNMDKQEWVLLDTLEPGKVHEWFGYYNYSHDSDATGPTMFTLEKYAAIIKDPECEALRTEEEFLTWVAVELPVECKE
jgi:hypothetical protein